MLASKIVVGAAPLFPEYKLGFLDRYGPCLHEYYGATETGVNTFITPEEIRERPSSVGKAFADNDLKIFDENGNEVPDGERGVEERRFVGPPDLVARAEALREQRSRV